MIWNVSRLLVVVVVLALLGVAGAAAATSHSARPARTTFAAVDLTPAQQCVRDGHLIPTVGAPTSAALKTASYRTIGGWAFLDADTPLVGARIRIVDGHGKPVALLRRSTSKTAKTGTFLVAVRTLPKSFRIVASGGRQNGKAFHGTLSAHGVGGTQFLSPVTTLVDAYRTAHPARETAQVVKAVKHTLGIPLSANTTTDIGFTNHLFDARKFVARGGFDRTVRGLVRTVHLGHRHLFRGPYALRGVGTDLLKWGGKQLANGAVSYVGGLGMGWLLGAAGISDDATAKQLDGIKGALDQINTKLTEIGQQLKDLNAKADQQILATTVVSLRVAHTAITGKSADLKYIAQMASVPHDKAYLESKACGTLADLYPLASGATGYGYPPDLVNSAFFPEPGVASLTQAFTNVVKSKGRWFTSASSDEVTEMLEYWTGIELAWTQIKLEWEHAVHPCAASPTPTAENCDAIRWAARNISDTSAQIDTLPLQVPSGMVIDTNTGLAWGPRYGDSSFLASPPPATYAETFGPTGDWMARVAGGGGPGQACSSKGFADLQDPFLVSLCAVALNKPGPFRSAGEWWPPTADQLNTLIAGSKAAGFNSPLDYLSLPWSEGGAGIDRAWLDQGNDKLWIYGCCSALDLTTGNSGAPSGGKAGFLLTTKTPVKEDRYWTSGGSTQFGGADPRIRYVETSGTDTTATGASNTCKAYLQPCKTVTHAVAVSGYAITVRIGGGTFSGPLTLERDITLAGAGPGLTSIDGGGTAAAVTIAEPIPVRIEGATITGGKPAGVENRPNGNLTLVDSTVAGNSGSGIKNQGAVTVLRSTIGPNAQWGIANWGSSAAERATIVNSTISGNTFAGLISNATGGPGSSSTTLINATVAGNGGSGVSGGGGSSKIQLTNTILSNQNCLGALEAGPGGHNLISNLYSCTFDAKGSAGNLAGVDAKLGPLGINGGPTSTLALLTGSPAIGAGDAATCAAAPVDGIDQRGYVRPSGSCDIGAYDSKALNIPVAG